MAALLRKWFALISIYAQEGLAYRANGFIWILTDTVPAMIMPLVFIASSKVSGEIGGYSNAQIVQYYLAMLVITNFITCHLMWELALEIKEGVFTTSLLRPVSYFQVCAIRNFVWRVLRLMYFIPALIVLLFFYRRYLTGEPIYLGWETWISIILGHLVSFSLAYMLTMLALVFQETRSIFELYYFPMLFLSGQMFPVYLMPDWIVTLAKALPFYYTTALPLDIMLHHLEPSASIGPMLVQAAWIAGHLIGARILWGVGLKSYAAVGM